MVLRRSRYSELLTVVFLSFVAVQGTSCDPASGSSPTSPSSTTTTAPPSTTGGEVRFTNLTNEAGFTSPPAYGGHGIQVADVNGDGWLDVYVTHIADPTENRPDLLFINQRRNPPVFEERGIAAGVSDDGFYEEMSEESHGAVFADFDNDGDLDLFNAHTWNGHNRLYRNEGDERFVDISESAGIDVTDLGSRAVGAADLDGNGRLEIIVTAWQDIQPIVYWNLGGLFFERRRVSGADNRPFANQGITVVDYDGDRKPDLAMTAYEYLENEGLGPVALLANDSPRFVDKTEFAGVTYEKTTRGSRGTSGWSFADIDSDGDLDALITGEHGTKLYRNNGEGRFHLVRRFDGICYTGAFGDVDNDGDMDLYLAGDTGLYFNDGDGGFSFQTNLGLSGIGADARSAVFADMNRDGALDLLIASKLGPNTFFRNEGRRGAWLQVSLRAPTGEEGAMGARVSLYPAGHLGEADFLRGFRVVHSATGYCSQDPPLLHFGVEVGELYDVRVEFQDGTVTTRTGLAPNQILRIDGSASPAP